MSTRGVIARKTSSGFEGVYHHFDSYPSGLGSALYDLYNGHFEKRIVRMLEVLIDEHRSGWSTIVDADFSLVPGYVEHGSAESTRPQCYCHGDRHDKSMGLITEYDKDSWAEYAYAIGSDGHMSIYTHHDKEWELMREIDLNADIDWTE